MDNLKVLDEVKWVAAAGRLSGTVCDITMGKNAAGELIPWITVLYRWLDVYGEEHLCKARIAGTESNLKMLKFKKVFA